MDTGRERLHVVIDGRVQGVGFRFAASRQATTLGLSGWVRNLDDGRVEAEFEGARDVLEAMLAWCWSGPSFADVADVAIKWLPPGRAPMHGFYISD